MGCKILQPFILSVSTGSEHICLNNILIVTNIIECFYIVLLETASAITLAINGTPENTDVDSELLDPYSSVELSLFKNLGLTTEKKTGSAKFIFGHEFLKQFSDFKDRIQNGIMVAVMEDTIKHMDSSALKGVSQLDVKLFCSSDKVTNISK